MIINVFPDREDRENLLHRLNLKPNEHQFVVDCDLLRSQAGSTANILGVLNQSEKATVSSRIVRGDGILMPSVGGSGTTIRFGNNLNRSTDGFDIDEDENNITPVVLKKSTSLEKE